MADFCFLLLIARKTMQSQQRLIVMACHSKVCAFITKFLPTSRNSGGEDRSD